MQRLSVQWDETQKQIKTPSRVQFAEAQKQFAEALKQSRAVNDSELHELNANFCIRELKQVRLKLYTFRVSTLSTSCGTVEGLRPSSCKVDEVLTAASSNECDRSLPHFSHGCWWAFHESGD